MNKENLIKTKNISLIPTNPDHSQIIYHNVFSNFEFSRLFRISNKDISEQQIKQDLLNHHSIPFKNRHYQEFLIFHEKYDFIGIAALAGFTPVHKRAEFLVGLFSERHRTTSSYALEATLAIMDYAFNQLKLNRLESLIYDYNLLARKATASLGFNYEGTRQEYIFSSKEQKYIDLYSFALTSKNFRKSQRLARLSKRLLSRDITLKPNTIVVHPAHYFEDELTLNFITTQ